MAKNDTPQDKVEADDVKRVDTAIRALQANDSRAAEALLLGVVQHSPKDYVYQYEAEATCFIKFWDMEEFTHYVLWQKKLGVTKPITWMGSAYPRAYYYLGFLRVKSKEYDKAIPLLDLGLALEPTNPKFRFEKAQALVGMKRYDEALALYDSVKATGPHVSSHELAVAMRGRGFVLTEVGDLDQAERAFEESLKIEPGNRVAFNELLYIAQLRRGGLTAPTEAVVTAASPGNKCAACGQLFTHGQIFEVDGKPAFLCGKCQNKRRKQWWQFWKWTT